MCSHELSVKDVFNGSLASLSQPADTSAGGKHVHVSGITCVHGPRGNIHMQLDRRVNIRIASLWENSLLLFSSGHGLDRYSHLAYLSHTSAMTLSFEGHTVVVTGAGGGLGKT